jgi:hypothetical protein
MSDKMLAMIVVGPLVLATVVLVWRQGGLGWRAALVIATLTVTTAVLVAVT